MRSDWPKKALLIFTGGLSFVGLILGARFLFSHPLFSPVAVGSRGLIEASPPASPVSEEKNSATQHPANTVSMPSPAPGTILLPDPGASDAEKLEFRRRLTQEGLRPVHRNASRNYPGTAPFFLNSESIRVPVHAALDEIYLPRELASHEILEIPAAQGLGEWRTEAAKHSPSAELVLYPVDQPRELANAIMLGKTLIVYADSPDQAAEYAGLQGWKTVQHLASETGALLVEVADPVAALEILRDPFPRPESIRVAGNFRRSIQPGQGVIRRIPMPAPHQPGNVIPPGAGPVPTSLSVSKLFTPTDPLFPSQWHLKNTNQLTGSLVGIDLNVADAWRTYQGSGVVVGVVDDGIEIAHPDLAANIATNSGIHYNWAGGATNNPNPTRSSDTHGTPMAGLVAARGNNALGVSGTAPRASLAGLRLISGPVTDANEILAHRWAYDRIAVKNNSWTRDTGTGTFTARQTTGVQEAIREAVRLGRGGLGTVFVWAAGNGAQNYRTGFFAGPRFSQDVSNYDSYANNIHVICVGAVDVSGVKTSYTERGANVAVSAPSSRFLGTGDSDLGLVSTDRIGSAGLDPSDYTLTNRIGGTSSATAQVSGVAALLLEANPQLSWRDVKEILMRSAKVVDSSDTEWIKNAAGFNFNPLYGAGLVNAGEAVELAASWTPLSLTTLTASRSASGLTLAPVDNDPAGVTQTFSFSESFRVESLSLTWSGSGFTIHDLVFYVTSPSGTTVRMNAVREDDYSTNLIEDLTFTTPYFWGETSAGTWTVKIVDEFLGGNCLVSAVSLTLHGSASPQAPGNDNFDQATILRGTSQSLSGLTNLGAGREEGEPRHAGVVGAGSLWWNYFPTASGYVTVQTSGSSIDTTLAVYRGDSLSTLEEVASNDNASSSVTWSRVGPIAVEAGESLKVVVEGKGSRTRGGLALSFGHEARALYDLFAGAKPVTGASWSDSRNTSAIPAYDKEIGEPAHAGVLNRSVWYRWVPGVTGTATVTTAGSSVDTVLAVYKGPALSRLTGITQNDNESAVRRTSKVSFGVVPGETYYLAVDARIPGPISVSGTVAAAPPSPGQTTPTPPAAAPTNNVFASAQAITGAPLRLNGINRSAGQQTGEPNASGQSTSVWYVWTAPRSGFVTMTTQNSLFDTTLGAYRGTSMTSLQTLAFNDNVSSGQRWSSIRFAAEAGSTYFIRVDGVRGANGRYYLNISY